MSSLVVYITRWCEACKGELPKIRRSASKLGLTPQIIDVDRCNVKKHPRCETVEFVPTVMLDGREISVQQLEQMASNKS